MSETPQDIGDTRPNSINHLVGQASVVEQVRVALDAAQQDCRKFDHSLLVGPPGIGKTATAQIIACEMATDCIEVLGQSIRKIADLNSVLLSATPRSIVFVDEGHELPRSLQTTLYLALDQKRILAQGNGRGSSPISIPVADFSLLIATSEEGQLLQPLRDR